jgi:Amt family ammonium transporter
MREAGLARAPSPSVMIKCLAVIAIATLATWLCGARLADGVEAGGFLGDFSWWKETADDPTQGGAGGARFLYQAGLAAAALMIVSGAIAERARIWPYLVFAAAFAGLAQPIVEGWTWGGGYLAARGFSDFAGASVIHLSAGCAALAGALLVGPRYVRQETGRIAAPQYFDAGLAGLGGVLASLGLLGLLAGAGGGADSVESATAAARALISAAIAASAGVVVAMGLTQIVLKRVDAAAAVNGAIGGLVALSAEPLAPALWQAAIIGAFAGAIVALAPPLLNRLRIDDVAGATTAHLMCGVWGTMIVPWTKQGASYVEQAIGVAMIAAFASAISFLLWTLLKYSIGVRAAE